MARLDDALWDLHESPEVARDEWGVAQLLGARLRVMSD
jgi:hypothetical protein